MPLWLVKTVLVLVFGPPLIGGVLLLIGGAWYMNLKERLANKDE